MSERTILFLAHTNRYRLLCANDIDARNYALLNHPGNNKRGGGIPLIHRNKYSVNDLAVDFKPKTFEYAV